MARLLLIDDDKLAAAVVKHALEQDKKHDVILAHDGEAGLVAARTELPDLILLDILMPKMNGYDVLKELKSTQSTLHIPVIILSAVSDEQTIKEVLYEYDTIYITKPVEVETLIKTVDHSLSCKE